MGCPMIQKTIQKNAFPTKGMSKVLSKCLVRYTRGACRSIPKKACSVTCLKGTAIIISCCAAEKKNTQKVAKVFDTPKRSL